MNYLHGYVGRARGKTSRLLPPLGAMSARQTRLGKLLEQCLVADPELARDGGTIAAATFECCLERETLGFLGGAACDVPQSRRGGTRG
jgi:hypothetical protein